MEQFAIKEGFYDGGEVTVAGGSRKRYGPQVALSDTLKRKGLVDCEAKKRWKLTEQGRINAEVILSLELAVGGHYELVQRGRQGDIDAVLELSRRDGGMEKLENAEEEERHIEEALRASENDARRQEEHDDEHEDQSDVEEVLRVDVQSVAKHSDGQKQEKTERVLEEKAMEEEEKGEAEEEKDEKEQEQENEKEEVKGEREEVNDDNERLAGLIKWRDQKFAEIEGTYRTQRDELDRKHKEKIAELLHAYDRKCQALAR